jgi:hypothetical protein
MSLFIFSWKDDSFLNLQVVVVTVRQSNIFNHPHTKKNAFNSLLEFIMTIFYSAVGVKDGKKNLAQKKSPHTFLYKG